MATTGRFWTFWSRYRTPLMAASALGWVIFISAVYVRVSRAGEPGEGHELLKIGALPVTCNLTIPIACTAMSAEGKPVDMSRGMDESGLDTMAVGMAVDTARQLAQYVRYSGWPELKEALMSGNLKAAMMLAPMAMDLADKGIPVKIVALGHRSGAVIMTRKDAPFKTFADLKGKRIAIPSRFAVDHIFVRKLMRRFGLNEGDLTMIEIPPPDMPAALLADAVDAYATGEPFGVIADLEWYDLMF